LQSERGVEAVVTHGLGLPSVALFYRMLVDAVSAWVFGEEAIALSPDFLQVSFQGDRSGRAHQDSKR
jgi:hypothetical protein